MIDAAVYVYVCVCVCAYVVDEWILYVYVEQMEEEGREGA
jgi:hypothetical protein